ncbi:MAG: non-lysosomal glucosylceramidase [Spirochaetia bacterium]|jgi:uncharacterized protein (DUF608 family)|nr:non-lysosomal glucosylceramidase [Spirochaetia bacterium]
MKNRYSEVLDYGQSYEKGRTGYRPKARNHDDGPKCGMFFGGIGAPVFSRDLDGHFSRWQLQSGIHIKQDIDTCFLKLRWQYGDKSGSFYLNEEGAIANRFERSVHSLFPVCQERYEGKDVPFDITVEFYSSIIPEDDKASSLPVTFIDVYVDNRGEESLLVDCLLCFPNLLGWKFRPMTTIDRGGRLYPAQTSAGNSGTYVATDLFHGTIGTRHEKHLLRGEMEGELLVAAANGCSRKSSEACFLAGQNMVEKKPEEQKYTRAWVEHQFDMTGLLPQTGCTWQAHWDEALAMAVTSGEEIAGNRSCTFRFCLAFDFPQVQFGEGRAWLRKYTQYFGPNGRNALDIGRLAMLSGPLFRERIHRWHTSLLLKAASCSKQTIAAAINELYFVNAGTAWMTGCVSQVNEGFEEPILGNCEHAAIIEGFDIGYYYYNTSDIWPYVWYPLAKFWPDFTACIFRDYLNAIPLEIPHMNMIYRREELRKNLVEGKLPHDMGSAAEDPFAKINGYQMRDDSNLWKDNNPGFILSYYLYAKLTAKEIDKDTWEKLKSCGTFMIGQLDQTGLPDHQVFGDTTWDNLGIKGHSSFSGSLTLAALLVLASLAAKQGEQDFAEECTVLAKKADKTMAQHLYNGEYFRLCDQGKYFDCTSSDAVFGFYLLKKAGYFDKLHYVTQQMIVSHLKAFYKYNFMNYMDGTRGPLLIATPERTHFEADGGDALEVQVNEILIGSAWMATAMMKEFGLEDEARHISSALLATQEEGALQFRTPAAVNAEKHLFRAPMNTRPLAIWFLLS